MARKKRWMILKGVPGQLIKDPRKPDSVVAYAGMRWAQLPDDEEPDDFSARFEPVPQLFEWKSDLVKLVKKGSLELIGQPFVATSEEAAAQMSEMNSEETQHGPDWD